jgi:hypothetical protein
MKISCQASSHRSVHDFVSPYVILCSLFFDLLRAVIQQRIPATVRRRIAVLGLSAAGRDLCPGGKREYCQDQHDTTHNGSEAETCQYQILFSLWAGSNDCT